jgi:hypothetical protein
MNRGERTWASSGVRGYANDPLLGKTFEIDRENPGFLRIYTTPFQNPGDAPEGNGERRNVCLIKCKCTCILVKRILSKELTVIVLF